MKYAELYNLEIVNIHTELPKAWKNLSYPNALSALELLDMSWSGNEGYAFYPYIEVTPDSSEFYRLSAVVDVVDVEAKTVTGTRTAEPISDEDAWAIVRAMRNNELTATDWTQLPDSPLTPEKKAEWAIYRQALRDVTTQENPREVVWLDPVT